MTDNPKHPEWPDHFEEGEWYYSPEVGPFQVIATDMEYVEDTERCRGELKVMFLHGARETLDAEGVVDLGLPDDVFHVPDRVVDESEAILAEFASLEIRTYVSKLGRDHPYNGIDGVNTVRDLMLADEFWSCPPLSESPHEQDS